MNGCGLFFITYNDGGIRIGCGYADIILFQKCYVFFKSPPCFIEAVLNRMSYTGKSFKVRRIKREK